MTSNVSVPAGSLRTIINIDDPRVEVPIESAIDTLDAAAANKDAKKRATLRSLTAFPKLLAKYASIYRGIDYNFSISYINKIVKRPIDPSKELSLFNVRVEFMDGREFEMDVPWNVQFFSRTSGEFKPVFDTKKKDVLVDYTGNIVRMVKKYKYGVDDNPPIPDIKDFYTVCYSSDRDDYKEELPYFFNGILAR